MTPSEQIDKRIAELGNWQREIVSQMRKFIHEAVPEIVEEWKWATPLFSHKGMVCALGAFKDHVKINFFKGSDLEDSDRLINAGFDSKKHRAIDFYEGDQINEEKLKKLIQAAVALNTLKTK